MTAAKPSAIALKNLPVFSPVAAKVMTLLRREHVDFKEAAELIKSDAGFSAELLRLASSPLTGVRYPPTSILHAISIVGVRKVASLTTTLSVGKLVRPVSRIPLMRRCWRHNLATALIARGRAEDRNIDSEDGYIFGLLAGIGRLALLVSEPSAYVRLANRAEAEDLPLDALERDFFGFDHLQAGAWLVTEWQLPKELLAVFHRDDQSSLTLLIRQAAEEATLFGFGVVEVPPINPDNPDVFAVAEEVNRIEQELSI